MTYYRTDPNDPDAPVARDEHRGVHVGDRVVYRNEAAPSWWLTTDPDATLEVSAFYDFGDYVLAILNDGEYEVNADNVVAAP